MDSTAARTLATRYLTGDPLTVAEEQELLDWLTRQADARDFLLADEALDRQLACLGRLESTAESFVAATLARVADQSRPANAPSRQIADCEPPISTSAEPALPTANAAANSASLPSRGAKRGSPSVWHGWSRRLVALAAALLLLAAGGYLLRESRRFRFTSSDVDPGPVASAPSTVTGRSTGFARLAALHNAVWAVPPAAPGERLSTGRLQLARGAADIRFDNGAETRLTGPSELEMRGPGEVFLASGTLTARVPPQAVGFTVVTPVGRVVDAGTEFEVSVGNAGTTATRVTAGRVSFHPQRAGQPPGEPLELTADGLDQAISTVPDVAAPLLPVSTLASSRAGRFVGTISADGQTLQFASLREFEASCAEVLQRLQAAPTEFPKHWSLLVEQFHSGQFSGHAAAAASTRVEGQMGSTGIRRLSIRENDQSIEIVEDASGITVTLTRTSDGREETSAVQAPNAEQLRLQHPAAYQLYRRHFGEATSPAITPAPRVQPRENRLPGKVVPGESLPGGAQPAARQWLLEQLREQWRHSADQPQLQQALERLLHDLDD